MFAYIMRGRLEPPRLFLTAQYQQIKGAPLPPPPPHSGHYFTGRLPHPALSNGHSPRFSRRVGWSLAGCILIPTPLQNKHGGLQRRKRSNSWPEWCYWLLQAFRAWRCCLRLVTLKMTFPLRCSQRIREEGNLLYFNPSFVKLDLNPNLMTNDDFQFVKELCVIPTTGFN